MLRRILKLPVPARLPGLPEGWAASLSSLPLRRTVPMNPMLSSLAFPSFSRHVCSKPPVGDLVLEGPHESAIESPDAETAVGSDKNMSIEFTCNKCKSRSKKYFSKLAYTKGLIIIRCPSCQALHLIADNIGWIKEQTPWRIGEQKHLLKTEADKVAAEAEGEDEK
ncbi:unnamed protein product [Schistocephalus solidus]|uniref:DNL-type zinc finger protein n=1 Tax=Schistocephalus solidus TaxID=70667 RepID=A0A0X3QDG7_SCHSO|nr:unnamed protein product [Schistocephalus solidus]